MNECEFIVNIKTLLEERKCEDALYVWNDDENKEIKKNVSWELVGFLCGLLDSSDNLVASTCKTILYDLEKICVGKEILLGMNEQLNKDCSQEALVLIVELCTNAFGGLQRKQSFYLCDLLEGFGFQAESFLGQSNTSEDLAEVGLPEISFEQKLKEFDCIVASLFVFVRSVRERIKRQSFSDLESYLQEVQTSARNWNEHELVKCREHLLKFHLHFLEIIAHLIASKSYKSTSREMKIICLEVVDGVFQLRKFLHLNELGSIESHSIGLLVLFYLVFVERISSNQHVPLVYNKKIYYKAVIPSIIEALKRTSKPIIAMAIKLHDYVTYRLSDESFASDDHYIKEEQCIDVALGFINVMIWSDDETTRKQAKEQLDMILKKWHLKERRSVLRSLYTKSEHAGVRGYIIDSLNDAMKKDFDNEETRAIFDMSELIGLFLTLEIGEHHVLQESQRLMAGLNFVRFWLLKDQKYDKKIEANTYQTIPKSIAKSIFKKVAIGIWDCVTSIEKHLSCVRCAIEVAVVEYKRFMTVESNENEDDIAFELSIPGDEILKGMSREDQQQVVNSALLTLDMMQSVIVRISEIIEGEGKTKNGECR